MNLAVMYADLTSRLESSGNWISFNASNPPKPTVGLVTDLVLALGDQRDLNILTIKASMPYLNNLSPPYSKTQTGVSAAVTIVTHSELL